jgi:Tfp pilus assembly protein PilX
MAMIALLVVTLVAGALFSSLIAAHRQSRRYGDQVQCQWLAEAGMARAAAKLKADARYQGEVWMAPLGADDPASVEPVSDEAAAAESGEVTIAVDAATKRITVVAVYPTDEHRRVTIRRESGGGAP